MSTTKRIGGRCTLRVGGVLVESPGEFTFSPGIPKRETALAADGPAGFVETPGEAMIEGEIYYLHATDIGAITSAEEVTVQLDLATGVQFVLAGAWFSGEGEIDNSKGTMAVKWTGREGRIVR